MIFPTVFLKNKVSIALGEMLFKLGRISNNFPNLALLLGLGLSLAVIDSDDEGGVGEEECSVELFVGISFS